MPSLPYRSQTGPGHRCVAGFSSMGGTVRVLLASAASMCCREVVPFKLVDLQHASACRADKALAISRSGIVLVSPCGGRTQPDFHLAREASEVLLRMPAPTNCLCLNAEVAGIRRAWRGAASLVAYARALSDDGLRPLRAMSSMAKMGFACSSKDWVRMALCYYMATSNALMG